MQQKKMRRKKYFFGMIFAMPYWQGIWHKICSACHFGSRRGPSVILAVF